VEMAIIIIVAIIIKFNHYLIPSIYFFPSIIGIKEIKTIIIDLIIIRVKGQVTFKYFLAAAIIKAVTINNIIIQDSFNLVNLNYLILLQQQPHLKNLNLLQLFSLTQDFVKAIINLTSTIIIAIIKTNSSN
jgi:hypothetical protein